MFFLGTAGFYSSSLRDEKKSMFSIAESAIQSALELGINHIDTANIYGNGESETVIGRIFKKDQSLRNKIFLQTKCGIKFSKTDNKIYYDTSKNHIVLQVEASLKKMGTDRLDSLLIHRPNPLMSAEEISEAVVKLVDSGKILNFGVSNFSPFQIELLRKKIPFPIYTNQIQLNLIHTILLDTGIEGLNESTEYPIGAGTLEYCQSNDVIIQVWSPIARGVLTANSTALTLPNYNPKITILKEKLSNLSIKYECAPESILIAWLLKIPCKVHPIIGSLDFRTMKACVDGKKVKLDDEDWYNLYRLSRGKDFP